MNVCSHDEFKMFGKHCRFADGDGGVPFVGSPVASEYSRTQAEKMAAWPDYCVPSGNSRRWTGFDGVWHYANGLDLGRWGRSYELRMGNGSVIFKQILGGKEITGVENTLFRIVGRKEITGVYAIGRVITRLYITCSMRIRIMPKF